LCADVPAPYFRETDADEVHAPKVFVRAEGELKNGCETESGASYLDGEVREIAGVVEVSRIVLEVVIFVFHMGIESETYVDP